MKFTRAALASLFTAAILVGGVAIPASAHTPAATSDCDALTVHLVSYETTGEDATPNVVTVTVDGTEIASERFGASFDAKYPLGDRTTQHSWSVQIDAKGDDYDSNIAGTSDACTPPPAAPAASAAVTVKAATCETGETLSLGAIRNATWGPPP